jgi:hypothetical protein
MLGWLLLFVASNLRTGTHPPAANTEFYVGTRTSTTATVLDGLTRTSAFSSLVEARDAVRSLSDAARCRGVIVTVLGGEYNADTLLLDGEQDSGCKGGPPVVWRGDGGGEVRDPNPIIHAGVRIPAGAFKPVQMEGVRMLKADLAPYGIDNTTFGDFLNAGACVSQTHRPSPPPPEHFQMDTDAWRSTDKGALLTVAVLADHAFLQAYQRLQYYSVQEVLLPQLKARCS